MTPNPLRAGFTLLEIMMATAVFAVVTMVATTSILTGTGLTTTVTQSSNAMGTTHRTAQAVSADLRYSDFNKIFLDNSTWKTTVGSASPRYFSFKRCTGFQPVTTATTMASLDRMVIYGQGVVLRFAQDTSDLRLGVLSQTVYALDASGNTGAVLEQDKILASGLAWQYYPTPDSTTPVDGFDIVDVTSESIANGIILTSAQGNELRMKVATVSDTQQVRDGTSFFEMRNVRLTQTSIFLRSTQFDRFGLEAPVISSVTTSTGSVGLAFIYDVTASNDPTSFTATGLPAGLSVNATTGRISGTPTTAGSVSVTITASNGVGTGSALLSLAVIGQKPVITSALAYSLQVGSASGYQITATAPTSAPVTSFGATGLPTGLSLGTNGAIVGQGTAAMIPTGLTSYGYNATISASNTNGITSANLVVTISQGPPPAPVITSLLTVTSNVGASLTYDITATNSPSSYTATNLPAGLTCSSSQGRISGTPILTTSASGQAVTISAINATGTGTATLYIVVNSAPIPVITESATGWSRNQGEYFSYQIIASNTPTSYRISKPTNLSWMSLNSTTGQITGIITTSTGGTVTLYATNSYGDSQPKDINLAVTAQPAPVVLSETKTAQVNLPFTYKITASNTPTSFQAGSNKPSWLTGPDASGNLSGTPTTAGLANTTTTMSLTATNTYGGSGAGTLTINIGPDPVLPVITLGSATTVTVSGIQYLDIAGTFGCGSAGTDIQGNDFSFSISPSTIAITNPTQSWSGNSGMSSATFTLRVPKTGTSAYTITVTVKDKSNRTATLSRSY